MLRMRAAPRPGAKVKCPKCQKVFAADEPEEVDEYDDAPLPPPRRSLPPRGGSSSRPKGPGKKKKESGGAPIVLILAIVGFVVVAGGIGGGVYFWMSSQSKQTASGGGATNTGGNAVAGGSSSSPSPGGSGAGASSSGSEPKGADAATPAVAKSNGETPEAAYGGYASGRKNDRIAELVANVTPDSRRVIAAGMVVGASMGSTDAQQMRDALSKRNVDAAPFEKALAAATGKPFLQARLAAVEVFNEFPEPPSAAAFEALHDLAMGKRPERLRNIKDTNEYKVTDVQVNGDKATGTEVMRVYLPPELVKQMKSGSVDKNGVQEIRKPIQFIKIDGRWYFDYAAQFPELPTTAARAGTPSPASGSPSPSTAGGSPSAAPPGTVQKVTLQNESPQEVYRTYIKALAANDWQTQFELLSSDYQTDTLMHVILGQTEGLTTLAMYPQQATPRDKKFMALFAQQGIDLKAAAKVQPTIQSMTTRLDRERAVKQFNELMKPVKSPVAFYVALQRFNSEVQEPFIKRQFAKCSVVDAFVDGDRAIVVLRNEAHPKTSPAGFNLVLAARENGKWFVDARPHEVAPSLPPEVMKKYSAQ